MSNTSRLPNNDHPPDLGLTHIALTVRDLDRSLAFYERFAGMRVVHRRAHDVGSEDGTEDPSEVAWISDLTRPFVIVLIEVPNASHPLRPISHLGVACASRAEVDRLSELGKSEGILLDGPTDLGPPVGYYAFLKDPDGHTLEISYGQEIAFTIQAVQPRRLPVGG